MRMLNTQDSQFNQDLVALLDRDTPTGRDIATTVQGIIADIRERGDIALLQYCQRFDKLDITNASELEITKNQLEQAFLSIDLSLQQALQHATDRIRHFHEYAVNTSWQYTEDDGTILGQQVRPLDKVGVYVPGGKAAYPSSVLMTVIPAKVAGVQEVIMVVPTPNGEVNSTVLAAAYLSQVDRVFTIGGAQAIAALAYGTKTIPNVDKIVGPGNIYVATAKQQVFGKVGIDMIAGPSEIVVIADKHANPDWVAMDLFAQAEHDELAQSILLSHSQELIDQVQKSIKQLLPEMPRSAIINTSLAQYGACIKTESQQESINIANHIAPEHLELMVDDAEQIIPEIRHAGAIFVGAYSAESLGDYCAGPNHVLPTAGTARFSSPLGVEDFQKRSSLIHISHQGAQSLTATASTLARSEGLISHALSAEYRKDEI